MKLKNLVLAGVLVLGTTTVATASDEMDPIGRKAPPSAPSMEVDSTGVDAAVLADIVREMSGEDSSIVVAFIDDIYTLKDKFHQVLEKEVQLKQSHVSNDEQRKLMTEYIQLLEQEKAQAKKVIETINKDLDAHESRLLQVAAKIHRIGDRAMKQTIGNVVVEVRKYVRYRLVNSQGGDRAFFMDAMRFLDQYFQA